MLTILKDDILVGSKVIKAETAFEIEPILISQLNIKREVILSPLLMPVKYASNIFAIPANALNFEDEEYGNKRKQLLEELLVIAKNIYIYTDNNYEPYAYGLFFGKEVLVGSVDLDFVERYCEKSITIKPCYVRSNKTYLMQKEYSKLVASAKRYKLNKEIILCEKC